MNGRKTSSARRVRGDASHPHSGRASLDWGADTLDDERVRRALTHLHRAIFKYPLAVQAAFSALVAEGRRFAETEEGAELKHRLASAEQTGRARMLWEVLSLGAFTERNESPLPSVMLETLVQTVRTRKLEPLLARLFEGRFRT